MQDRNFDDLAVHFEKNIYKKQKGKLRHAVIWRDLEEVIPNLRTGERKVTDIGAGFGQFVTALASLGHFVTYNDISTEMSARAQALSATLDADILSRINWFTSPYQTLPIAQVDLLLCHAVIEWLAEPEQLLPNLAERLSVGGYLSLCTYNPVGYTMRNLIAGNFKLLDRNSVPDFKGSLTPTNPQSLEQIKTWLQASGFDIIKQSGIRVFSDYAFVKRGGLEDEQAIFDKEMIYSDQAPFNQIGRYVHLVARKSR